MKSIRTSGIAKTTKMDKRWTKVGGNLIFVYVYFGFFLPVHTLGCALFYKPIWQLTVNERGHYADSEDTFLFKIEDSPDTRLGA